MSLSEIQDTAGSLSYGLAAIEPPIPMLIVERELKIRWISQAAIKEFGTRIEQFVGRSWYDIVPESRARRALHEEMFRGEREALDLYRIPLTLGGCTRYFSMHLRTLRAANGSVESILALGEDVTKLVEAEDALRASEARFRAVSTYSGDMIVICTADGTLNFQSEAVERILGPRLPPPAVVTIFDNMHPDDVPLARENFENLVNNPAVGVERDIEIRQRHEDGGWRWLQITASNLLDNPAVRGVVLNARDVTTRRQAQEALHQTEQQLRSSLREKEVLLQEIHHRVKNNLQVISSLINLQMRRLKDPLSQGALEECQHRVLAIALIHEKLYQSKRLDSLPMSDYVSSLAHGIFQAGKVETTTVSLHIAVEDIALPIDKAIPCGLILNELITNALKHAFVDGRQGAIHIRIDRLSGSRLRLIVADNGVGLPASLDPNHCRSMGLQLVNTLAEQLAGQLEVDLQGGSSFQLTFPIEQQEGRDVQLPGAGGSR
jgi:PAS domain S-box-containing protein